MDGTGDFLVAGSQTKFIRFKNNNLTIGSDNFNMDVLGNVTMSGDLEVAKKGHFKTSMSWVLSFLMLTFKRNQRWTQGRGDMDRRNHNNKWWCNYCTILNP